MADVAANVRILDRSGALVLDLDSAGFVVRTISHAGRTWRTVDVSSPWVDGDDTVVAALASDDYAVQVGLQGSSWVVVEQKYALLQAAVEQQRWLLEVSTEGVTRVWRVNRPADSRFPGPDAATLLSHGWTGTFVARVQPTPAIAGI